MAAAALALVAPAPADARVVCGPSGAPTIAETGRVRVYVGKVRSVYGDVHRRTVACLKGGRRVPLDDPEDAYGNLADSKVRRRSIVIRSHFVAYAIDGDFSEGAAEHDYTHVEVVNLRTGKFRWDCPSGEDLGCAGSGTRISDLVLRRDGALAFIGRRELVAIGSGGHSRTLTRSADPGSLALRGRVLSWTESGQRRTTRLN